MTEPSLRQRLRALPVFAVAPTPFDAEASNLDPRSLDPIPLVIAWLDAAIAAGVLEPHAMTIATTGPHGPSARTLLLKDVTAEGFWFASSSESPKGRDLRADPRCALTLYWKELGRQVRVTGDARSGPPEVSAADFRERHPAARAAAIAGEQSAVLPVAEEVERRLDSAARLLGSHPDYALESWLSYCVAPRTVEFWQADGRREMHRRRYELREGLWHRESLWP